MGHGRWGRCARTCLGEGSATPAVRPAPSSAPSLGPQPFAPTRPRSRPRSRRSPAPTATRPHVKAGFVLRSGTHAAVTGAEPRPRPPPCRRVGAAGSLAPGLSTACGQLGSWVEQGKFYSSSGIFLVSPLQRGACQLLRCQDSSCSGEMGNSYDAKIGAFNVLLSWRRK